MSQAVRQKHASYRSGNRRLLDNDLGWRGLDNLLVNNSLLNDGWGSDTEPVSVDRDVDLLSVRHWGNAQKRERTVQ